MSKKVTYVSQNVYTVAYRHNLCSILYTKMNRTTEQSRSRVSKPRGMTRQIVPTWTPIVQNL